MEPNEVQSKVFVTVKQWVLQEHGPELYANVLSHVPVEFRDALDDPIAGQWHPEEVHAAMLQAAFEVVCESDLQRFHELIMATCDLGIRKFARLILAMTSEGFVLRRLPALWNVIRRGPATTTVEHEGNVAHITYRYFPYFDDVLYRSYIVAVVTAILRTVNGVSHPVEVLDWDDDILVIRVRLEASSERAG